MFDRSSDEFAEMYSQLCNFFWYLEHPDWPVDGLLHTSDRCRTLSLKIVDLVEGNLDDDQIALGSYDSEIEAAQAYNIAAKFMFGSSAELNDVPEPSKELVERVHTILKGRGLKLVQ